MKRKWIITGITLILCLNVFAAEIDIDKAVKMAEDNNPEIKKVEKDYSTTILQKKEAIKYVLPKLSLSYTLGRTSENVTATTLGTTITTFGAIKVKPVETREIPDTDRLFSNTLTVTQPIYYAGKEWAGVNMADIGNKISKITLEQKRRDIKIAAVEDYMTLLKAQKIKEILEKSVKEMRINYDKMNEMYNLKMISKTSVLDLNTRLINLESSLISADMAVELAKLNLKSRIGIPLKDDVAIKEVPVNAASMSAIKLEEDIKYATENKSVFKILELNKKLKENDKRVTFGDLLPQIGLQFQYNMKGTKVEDSLNASNSTWNAGISIAMNLWDWGITLDKLKEKDNDISKQNIDIKMTKDNIEMAVRKNYFDIERLKKLIDSKTEALKSAQETYSIEKEKLDLKMSTATDFLSAENNLRTAETELVNTKIDYYIAYKKYYNFIEREAK